jgi:hypothetical protein
MKLKAIFEGALAAIVVTVFSYRFLRVPATLAALAIERRMPDAWFSSSIVFYASAAVLVASVAIAGVVFRIVYKHARAQL